MGRRGKLKPPKQLNEKNTGGRVKRRSTVDVRLYSSGGTIIYKRAYRISLPRGGEKLVIDEGVLYRASLELQKLTNATMAEPPFIEQVDGYGPWKYVDGYAESYMLNKWIGN